MRFQTAVVLVLALAVAPATAWAGAGVPGHTHDGFAFGEPGNPKKPARIVEVSMKEVDGRMTFLPDRIEVRQGERVRFKLINAGQLDHEFMLGTVEDNQKHAALMQKFPEMEHDDPNGKSLKIGDRNELVWMFSKPGTFEFACLRPGHYEAGMKGTLVVLPIKQKLTNR
ncbi:cupredoxin domain-containing protein [Prosthecodimorpha staleyi]|uniref:Cupredoxin family protein n=1 Tax=Prosthecodimorpha staleyi TaxID=2840188 RepID=A0A947GDJ1_9HYPH|nr:cupredoxin family protein [Prosthecodimorpha staleyi]MBT9290897.1 cupredoxin family protein [Prosthecodimorpha staleyi]